MKPQRKILRWDEPPNTYVPVARKQAGSQWDAVAATLRAEPGRSAVIYEGSRSAATGIASVVNDGRTKCFTPAGSFRATLRTVPGTKTVEVYAKHVGGEET